MVSFQGPLARSAILERVNSTAHWHYPVSSMQRDIAGPTVIDIWSVASHDALITQILSA